MILFDSYSDKTVVYGGRFTLEARVDSEGRWDIYNRSYPSASMLSGFPSRKKATKAAIQLIKGGKDE